MGLLDRVAKVPGVNFFVRSDEEEVPTTEKEPIPVQASTGPSQTSPAGMPSVFRSTTMPGSSASVVQSVLSIANVDPELRAKIETIANSADQVSFRKFQEQLTVQRSVFGPDDSICYKAALAGAKASGYLLTEVMQGLDVILRDLGQAEAKFKQAVPERISKKVASRQQRMNEFRQTIANRRGEMERLQEALKRLEGEVSELTRAEQAEAAAISQDEKAIRDDEAKFSAAMEAVKSSYLNERQKVETYGRGL